MAELRQNANWNEAEENQDESVNHGNTRLPYGLCERYGISLPDNATPRDAWDALEGKGITPKQVYAELTTRGKKKSGDEKQRNDLRNQSNGIETTHATSTSHMSERAKIAFDEFQARTAGKHLKHEEAVVCASNGEVVISKRGQRHQVSWTIMEAQKMKGADMIHNHTFHCSVLSPSDANSIFSEEKSCTMCDIDGNRMTIVYDDGITPQERANFAHAYAQAFNVASQKAIQECRNDSHATRMSLYADRGRSKKIYDQDFEKYQQIVKREIMAWANQNARKYKVEIFYEQH